MTKPWGDGFEKDDFYHWHNWVQINEGIYIDQMTPMGAWNLYRLMCRPYEEYDAIKLEKDMIKAIQGT